MKTTSYNGKQLGQILGDIMRLHRVIDEDYAFGWAMGAPMNEFGATFARHAAEGEARILLEARLTPDELEQEVMSRMGREAGARWLHFNFHMTLDDDAFDVIRDRVWLRMHRERVETWVAEVFGDYIDFNGQDVHWQDALDQCLHDLGYDSLIGQDSDLLPFPDNSILAITCDIVIGEAKQREVEMIGDF